jgi:uncharacterized CHY-type Zn-finger protein
LDAKHEHVCNVCHGRVLNHRLVRYDMSRACKLMSICGCRRTTMMRKRQRRAMHLKNSK